MATPRESLIPNSTQVPNLHIDLVIPRLPTGDHAKAVLYVCRRTFGFQKKSDTIGLTQFAKGIISKEGERLDYGAGIAYSTARGVLDDLCEAKILIKVSGSTGRANRYRLNLELNADEAVQACAGAWKTRSKSRRTRNVQPRLFEEINPDGSCQQGAGSSRQGTLLAKPADTLMAVASTTKQRGNKGKQSIAGETPAPSRFKEFLKWYEDLATRSRGLKLPLKITAAGKSNLGKFLQKYKPEWELMEQLALYFLVDPHYKQFSPGLETFLSAGIMNGLLNDASNREDFWKKVDGYVLRYLRMGEPAESISEQQRQSIAVSVAQLLAGMKAPVVTVDE